MRFCLLDKDGFAATKDILNDRRMMDMKATQEDILRAVTTSDKLQLDSILWKARALVESKSEVSDAIRQQVQSEIDERASFQDLSEARGR